MPLQTSYAQYMDAGAVGRRANMEEWNTITCLAEDVTSNPIGFAQPVMRGSADEKVKKYDGSGSFRGLTEADVTLGAQNYPEGANTPVCESGVIWALAGDTCTAGESVGWDSSTGKYENGSSTNTIIPNAEFDSSAASGQLVKIRLRRIPAAA